MGSTRRDFLRFITAACVGCVLATSIVAEENAIDVSVAARAATASAEQKKLDRLAATIKPYFPIFDTRYLSSTGGTVTGPLVLKADPVETRDAATKGYVDNAVAGAVSSMTAGDKVDRSGDTMNGPLMLKADPTSPLQAATKQYVDQVVNAIPIKPNTNPASPSWLLSGNAGTNGTNFLGTNDNQALEFKVNSHRAFRIEPVAGTDGAPNIIGGSPFNTIAAGSESCIIAGGGFSLNPNVIRAIEGGTIGGGESNTISSNFGTIAGGFLNTANLNATVSGGLVNSADAEAATVGGGMQNAASGKYAVVPGGVSNSAKGQGALAAGSFATAAHAGEFVWADGSGKAFPSAMETLFTAAENDFLVRATGGVVFVTGVDSWGNATAGAKIAPGSGSWTTLSDRTTKANFANADVKGILKKVSELPIQTWNYKSQSDQIRHLGPMSQDFYAAFGLGEDAHGIPVVDGQGVALASIQALAQIIDEKQKQIDALKAEHEMINQRLSAIEKSLVTRASRRE
jgi:hypothetical protein